MKYPLLSPGLSELLFERFKNGDLELDLCGHDGFELGAVLYSKKNYFEYLFSLARHCKAWWNIDSISLEEPEVIAASNFTEFSKITGIKQIEFSSTPCSICDKYYYLIYDGNKVVANKQCEFPGGISPWELEIDVPSGILVFKNDMRDLFEPCNISVNSVIGIKRTEEHYAKQGMFHVCVGNTCPSIVKLPNGNISVGYLDDDNYDENIDGVKVGKICTDLWWFGACDYDDFVKRNHGKEPGKNEFDREDVVNLPKGPGRYKLTSYYGASRDESLSTFALIEKKENQEYRLWRSPEGR